MPRHDYSHCFAPRYGDAKTLPAQDVLIRTGYDSILDHMLPGLDVRYNEVVASISQDPATDIVTVATTLGQQFKGHYCVVTVPLGCMKAGTIDFDPPLPRPKLEAVESMVNHGWGCPVHFRETYRRCCRSVGPLA
jgi:hypothetical protein